MTSWFFLCVLLLSEFTSCAKSVLKSPSFTNINHVQRHLEYSPMDFISHNGMYSCTPKSIAYSSSGSSRKGYRLSSRFMDQIGSFIISENGPTDALEMFAEADEGPFRVLDIFRDFSLFLQSLMCHPFLMTGLNEAINLCHAFIDSNFIFMLPDHPGTFEIILKAMIYSLLKNEVRAYLDLLQHFKHKLASFSDREFFNFRVETTATLVIAALFKDEISLETFGSVSLDSVVFFSALAGVTPEEGSKLFLSEALTSASTSLLSKQKYELFLDRLTGILFKDSTALPIDPISINVRVSVFALCFEFICRHRSAVEFHVFLATFTGHFKDVVISVDDIMLMLIAVTEMNYTIGFRNVVTKFKFDVSKLLSLPPSDLNRIKTGLKKNFPRISELELNPETFQAAPDAGPVLLEIFSEKNYIEVIYSQMLLKKLYQPLDVILAGYTARQPVDLQTLASYVFHTPNVIEIKEWILQPDEFRNFHHFMSTFIRSIITTPESLNQFVLNFMNELPSAYLHKLAIERIVSYSTGVKDLFNLAVRFETLFVMEVICGFYRLENDSWELLSNEVAAQRSVTFFASGEQQMIHLRDELGNSLTLPFMVKP